MALRIAHLSFSSSGGAGTVATRLADIQNSMGHDARLICQISGSLRDAPLANPLHTAAAAADQFLVKNPSFEAPISLYRDQLSQQLSDELKDVDVIHLHWPHGLINIDTLGDIAGDRPVVWTLHDMASFTGVCHYSLDCEGFVKGCSGCPAVRKPLQEAVQRHLAHKAAALSQIRDFRIVSPSQWLAAEAMRSSVLFRKVVSVIPNPLPLAEVPSISEGAERDAWHVAPEKVVFGVVAASVDDALKGVADVVTAFTNRPTHSRDAHLLIAGRNSAHTDRPGVTFVGRLSAGELGNFYGACDYLIVNSQSENQPLVVSEAQAHGVSLLARDHSGLPEHLDIDPEGALFSSTGNLSHLIHERSDFHRAPGDRVKLARAARAKFDPVEIADRYLEVYTR